LQTEKEFQPQQGNFHSSLFKWRTKRILQSKTIDELFVLLKVNPTYQLDSQMTCWDLLSC
jgi:hypothetical protein